jgi:hypothetical protein
MSLKRPPTYPGQRGIESTVTLLKTLPPYWRRSTRSVEFLLDRAFDEMCNWHADSDRPVASLQKCASYLVLALELGLSGVSPVFTPAAPTPEEETNDRRVRTRPRPRRRYHYPDQQQEGQAS